MIKAIETNYGGYRFRSRLEARWAVFFDELGIEWEYEKEGYEDGGVCFLPDFYLPNIGVRTPGGCFVEIKANEEEIKNNEQKFFMLGKSKNLIVFPGLYDVENPNGYDYSRGGWDNSMGFLDCATCGAIRIDYMMESNYRNCLECFTDEMTDDNIIESVLKARAERF